MNLRSSLFEEMNHDYNDEHNRSMTFESDDKMKSSNIDIKSDSPAVLEWTPKVQVPTSSIEVTDIPQKSAKGMLFYMVKLNKTSLSCS